MTDIDRVYLADRVEMYSNLTGKVSREEKKCCSCECVKLSVRLDDAWCKFSDLYETTKYFCFVPLMISSLMRWIYLFFKKLSKCVALMTGYFQESSTDQYNFEFSKGGTDYYSRNKTMECLCKLFTLIFGIILVVLMITACVFWTLSNFFLLASLIWLFKTDLEYESDYFVKIRYLRKRMSHYNEKIKGLSANEAKLESNSEKLSKIKEEILYLIKRKIERDNLRYGRKSPQTLVDEHQKLKTRNIVQVIDDAAKDIEQIIECEVEEEFKEEFKSASGLKLKIMEENPTMTLDEIRNIARQNYMDLHSDEIINRKSAMLKLEMRKIADGKSEECGNVSKEEIESTKVCFGNLDDDLISLLDEFSSMVDERVECEALEDKGVEQI